MTKSQERWWYQHGRGKWRYRTRWTAWRAVLRIWIRERKVDTLVPYECRWTADWSAGRTGPLHYHIGHGRHTLRDRFRYQLRHRIVYPFYRARSRCRRWVRHGRRVDGNG